MSIFCQLSNCNAFWIHSFEEVSKLMNSMAGFSIKDKEISIGHLLLNWLVEGREFQDWASSFWISAPWSVFTSTFTPCSLLFEPAHSLNDSRAVKNMGSGRLWEEQKHKTNWQDDHIMRENSNSWLQDYVIKAINPKFFLIFLTWTPLTS